MKVLSNMNYVCFLALAVPIMACGRRNDVHEGDPIGDPIWTEEYRSNMDLYGSMEDESAVNILDGLFAEQGQFPYQALVSICMNAKGKENCTSCSGAILDETHVVTAAHCFDLFPKENNLTVSVGAGNTKRYETATHKDIARHSVSYYELHNKYTPESLSYDIALLTLDEGLVFDKFIRPIKIAKSIPKKGRECFISGWGSISKETDEPIYTQNLKYGKQPISENQKCTSHYGMNLDSTMLCAGYKGHSESPCVGDDGAPLACDGKLVGLAIAKKRKSCAGHPSVYVNIVKFKNWLINNGATLN